MFKKPATLKPAAPLRSSARRALLAHLQILYPILQHALPEHVLEVVPSTIKQCGAKTSSGEKAVIYTDGTGVPLWFEVGHDAGLALTQSEQQRKRGAKDHSRALAEVIPTLYVVWLMPQLLPRLPTWPQIVDPVLLGGSALMVPGLIPAPSTFPRHLQWPPIANASVEAEESDENAFKAKRNDLVSIVAYPSSVPMAIARLEDDAVRLVSKRKAGEKGKAAVMLHCKGDWLASMTPKVLEPPSEEEVAGRIVAIRSEGKDSEIEALGEELTSLDTSEVKTADRTNDEKDDEGDRSSFAMSVGQIDEILYLALLTALSRIADDQLPMPVSALYSGHVLVSRPAHWPPRKAKGTRKSDVSPSLVRTAPMDPEAISASNVDVRQSSFKKLAKWLKTVERQGLLKVKDIKGKDLMLISIDRSHRDLIDLCDYLTVNDAQKQPAEPSASSTMTKDLSSVQPNSAFVVRTESFWRAGSSAVKLFQQMHCSTSLPLTRAQIRRDLLAYIDGQALVDARNRANVKIDDPHLTHALYPKVPLNEIPPVLRREEVLDTLLRKSCNEYHRMSRLLASRDKTIVVDTIDDLQAGEYVGPLAIGPPKPVQVEIKVRQGRKHVSLISNLEQYAIEPDTFAADLMRIVGASASASQLPTSTLKQPKSEVFVQGDQRKAILTLLENNHGLTKNLQCH